MKIGINFRSNIVDKSHETNTNTKSAEDFAGGS